MDSKQKLLLFLHVKVPKKKEKEKNEWMNEVKDENFKYSASVALNCFYIGQYLL